MDRRMGRWEGWVLAGKQMMQAMMRYVYSMLDLCTVHVLVVQGSTFCIELCKWSIHV